MNIGFNSVNQNNSPKFGMAVKTTFAAEKIIEEQISKMSPNKGKEFVSNLKMIADTNKGMFPNIKLRASRWRDNVLVAEVKDPFTGKVKKFAQKLFNPTGDVTPLNQATAEVDKIAQKQENLNKFNYILK